MTTDSADLYGMTDVPSVGRRRLAWIAADEIWNARVSPEDQFGQDQRPEPVQPSASDDVAVGDLGDGPGKQDVVEVPDPIWTMGSGASSVRPSISRRLPGIKL